MANDEGREELDLEPDEQAGPSEALAEGPPGTVSLRGYLGEGTDETVRLWISEEEYFEVPTVLIRRRDRLPSELGTRLWVDEAISADQLEVQTTGSAADFLGGPISEDFLAEYPEPANLAEGVTHQFAKTGWVYHTRWHGSHSCLVYDRRFREWYRPTLPFCPTNLCFERRHGAPGEGP